MSDYKNSFAQKNNTFITETVYSTIPGDNFFRAMVFVGVSDAATYFTAETPPVAGYTVELTAANYTDYVQGLLLNWMSDLFANSMAYSCWIVVYTDEVTGAWDETDLGLKFAEHKYKAYWKTTISSTYQEDSILALDALWTAEGKDKKLTQVIVGTSDSECLDDESTTSIAYLLNDQLSNAMVVYHYDSTKNPALAQLGKTLSLVNEELDPQAPVGSKIAIIAFNTINPSGTAGTNLDADDYGALESQYIGYFEYVGNGTSNVVMIGGKTLKGEIVVANWIKYYINFVCEIKAAELLSQRNKLLNSATYQEILTLTDKEVRQFVTFGRFTDYSITNKAFSSSNVSEGKFVIANAWQATYVDDAEGVTVYGTLYITV